MASLLVGASSCSDTFDATSDQQGRLVLDLNVSHDVAAPANAPKGAPARGDSRAPEAKQITAADLSLTLRSTSGSFVQTWSSLADFDPAQDFPVGAYEFEATYGTKGQDGFDSPYYYGMTQLSIRENQTTPVSVTARLANAMVSIVYTDEFKGYFTKYSTEVQTPKAASIEFTADETRAAYVETGHVEVFANVTKPNGLSAKLAAASFEAEARHHYVVTLDIDAGSGTLNITFNSDLVEEEVPIDISDQVLMAPAPTLAAVGFTPGETLKVVEGSHAAADKVRMVATAYGEVATGVLTTSSESLYTQRFPSSVDFASAQPTDLAVMGNLGFKEYGFTGIKSQMAIADFTELIPQLTYVEGGDNTSTFTLVAKDKYAKVSEPLTLTVEVEKLQMSVVSTRTLYVDEETLSFTLAYNGNDAETALQVRLKNARGTWSNATISSITPAGEGQYTVVVEIPAKGDIVFQCTSGSLSTGEIEVKRTEPNHNVSFDGAGAFATYAIGSLGHNDGSDASADMSSTTFYLSTDDANYSKVDVTPTGSTIRIDNLKPATTYYLKAMQGGKFCSPAVFTTEAAPQLPYSDMETWEIQPGGSDYWWKSYLGPAETTPWGSMNLITTSAGGSGTNAFKHDGCAYVARSGTDRTDDKHSGAYAAVVKTIGWGYSDANGGMNAKNLTVGSLHLGTTPASGEPTYGYSFASRPSALKFWYKYSPRNSADYGYAEVQIKDANGNVIAEGKSNLNAVGNYTQHTFALDYAAGSAKAATICVTFRSSNNPACQTISNDNLTKPGFGNLSDGKYEGSLLYIDDIELTY